MKYNNTHYQTISICPNTYEVSYINQTKLPYIFELKKTLNYRDLIQAIQTMEVRGAPVIGICGALAFFLAIIEFDKQDESLLKAKEEIIHARPTAINLRWAVEKLFKELMPAHESRILTGFKLVSEMIHEDILVNKKIGEHGYQLFQNLVKKDAAPLNILTHCNAGWLATVDYGTALSPIFNACSNNFLIHVWVDETRPRNQGLLTAWELEQYNIPHTLIADNTGALLMQQKKIDLIIVGADRISIKGHVCNKVGTFLKAIAAHYHNIPFYVAAPLSTVDQNFVDDINFDIEERSEDEMLEIYGMDQQKKISSIRFPQTKVYNPAFDVTPAKLITGIITEQGLIEPPNLEKILE
jgi:methylthioribose-1-phosphate isomerase